MQVQAAYQVASTMPDAASKCDPGRRPASLPKSKAPQKTAKRRNTPATAASRTFFMEVDRTCGLDLYCSLVHSFSTYGHRHRRTRDPVRSPLVKPVIGGLVVGSVTTSEYPLLYVFFVDCDSILFCFFLFAILIFHLIFFVITFFSKSFLTDFFRRRLN